MDLHKLSIVGLTQACLPRIHFTFTAGILSASAVDFVGTALKEVKI